MVEALNKGGANSIWEYSLMDQTASPTSCKPSFSEPHLAKEEFIRSKHEDLSYILRSEQEVDGAEGLGAQLHSAARTSDLLTSLRLFSQGADPNFYHEEKGSCPLHVAAKTNQTLQAELLMVFGADLCRRDSAGRTPEDVARDSGNVALAERLRTARFHVFDRLLQYLCSRKPEHGSRSLSGLSALDELSFDGSEYSEGRTKLEALSNSQFEKLVADIYDEVDRREAGAAWMGEGRGVDPAAFLPPHPELSATRNQGRQKLARLPPRDMDQLLRDILRDAKRRDISFLQTKQIPFGPATPLQNSKLKTDISDDEPLYDSVASDDDYAYTNGGEVFLPANQSQAALITNVQSAPKNLPNGPQNAEKSNTIGQAETRALRDSLVSSEATIARLQTEIKQLTDQMAGLLKENQELKEVVTKSRYSRTSEAEVAASSSRTARPMSMYEARDRTRNVQGVRGTSAGTIVWPEYKEVLRRMEIVKKRIQELWSGMKVLDLQVLAPSAARIATAIQDLISLFPLMPQDELIRQLTTQARQLEVECICLGSSAPSGLEQGLDRIRVIAYDMVKATKQLVLLAEEHSARTE